MWCSIVLSGCEDVSDEGLMHLSHLSLLASLNLSNCCKVLHPLGMLWLHLRLGRLICDAKERAALQDQWP